MEIVIGWIILCIIIGALGSKRKIGFAGAFFLSLLLSPVIGLIITLFSKDIEDEKYKEELLNTQKQQQEILSNLESRVKTGTHSEELETINKIKDGNNTFKKSNEFIRDEIDSKKIVEDDQILILQKLKDQGILTNTEYEAKINDLNNLKEKKENENEEKRKYQILELRLKKKSQSLIDLILAAKDKGLITNEDFLKKEKEIIENCKLDLKQQEANISYEVYNKLSPTKIERVEQYLETIDKNDLIVLHHNKVKLIKRETWDSIVSEGISGNYAIIYKCDSA